MATARCFLSDIIHKKSEEFVFPKIHGKNVDVMHLMSSWWRQSLHVLRQRNSTVVQPLPLRCTSSILWDLGVWPFQMSTYSPAMYHYRKFTCSGPIGLFEVDSAPSLSLWVPARRIEAAAFDLVAWLWPVTHGQSKHCQSGCGVAMYCVYKHP